MKNVLTLLALLLAVSAQAQTFQWNEKGGATVTPHPKEVQVNSTAMQAYDRAYNEKQTGLAGIYNPNSEGSRTIFGETYRGKELTASHALLPLGTLARVINLDNGREVTVRINDKGQECADCLLMLSSAAATQLGINYRARVSVERTGFSNWNPAPPAMAAPVQQPVTYTYRPPVTQQPVPQPQRATAVYPPVRSTNNNYQAPQQGVVRPATIGGNDYGWEPKSAQRAPAPAPAPSAYDTQPASYGNYATLGAPTNASGVTSREVQPTYPATNGSYRPTAPATYNPPVVAAPQPYRPAPATQPSATVAPPPSTVRMYQQSARGGSPAVAAPVAYNVAPVAPVSGTYSVQLAAYNNVMYAQRRVAELQNAGMPGAYYASVTKPDGQVINRVYSGRYAGAAEAQQAADQIRATMNIAGIVTRM